MTSGVVIGVIGAGRASDVAYAAAREVGRLLAEAGAMLVCGGLGGVMEGACRGCTEAGGLAVGILPGAVAGQANPWVGLPIVTNLGHARNIVIAHTAQALIAIEGEYGTLSEIAVALKLGKPVVSLRSWSDVPGMTRADTPEEAVHKVFALLSGRNP
jgi:uncharacterized protein (TIGR00725 family)